MVARVTGEKWITGLACPRPMPHHKSNKAGRIRTSQNFFIQVCGVKLSSPIVLSTVYWNGPMPFRIHKMREAAREAFRWSAHTGGQAVVKQKDYEAAGEIEAVSEYAAWKLLQERGQSLQPGDVLELIAADSMPGQLKIFKYIGFEPAIWWVPAPKPAADNPDGLNSLPKEAEFPSSL
jgi:hypothetical protein